MISLTIFLNDYFEQLGIPESIGDSQICFKGYIDGELCFNLHIAEIPVNDLYIWDILLSNPKLPKKPNGDPASLGGGIFDIVIQNLKEYAKKRGYKRISLEAAFQKSMQTFAKRGFEIENNYMGEMAKMIQRGYPMRIEFKEEGRPSEKKIKRKPNHRSLKRSNRKRVRKK